MNKAVLGSTVPIVVALVSFLAGVLVFIATAVAGQSIGNGALAIFFPGGPAYVAAAWVALTVWWYRGTGWISAAATTALLAFVAAVFVV